MSGNDKKKKITRSKLLKCANGAISIFLCIIITPFLSITLSLVEYARYQEVIAITEELMELTGVSVLTDYDTYLHDRFGLLATSQEDELDEGVETLLKDNMKLLGAQTTITRDSCTVSGEYALSEISAMKRQIVSVGELAAPAAVLIEDLQLDELLEKLNNITAFANLTSTFTKMKEVTDALTVATEKLDNLQGVVDNVNNQITIVRESATTFAEKLNLLYTTINTEEGIALPNEFTEQDVFNAVTNFGNVYLDDVKSVCESANIVYTSIGNLKDNLDALTNAVTEFKDSVTIVRSKIDAASNKEGENEKVAQSASPVLQTVDAVTEEMETLINGTLKSVEVSAIETAKGTLNTIYQNILEKTGLKDILNRYHLIVTGQYFDELPLDENEQEDLKGFMETARSVYESKNGTGILEYLKGMFVPDLSGLEINSLVNEVGAVINATANKFLEETLAKAVELMNQLVSLLKSLFSMELFFNPDLNAFVDIGNGLGNNPYQKFLESVGNIFTAVETLGNALEGKVGLIEAAKAFGSIFSSAADVLQSIFTIAWNSFSGLYEVIKNLAGGNVGEIYEQLVIASYMRHNLSNRTNAGISTFVADGGNVNYNTPLSGSGLTMFEYENIPRATRSENESKQTGGLLGLVDFINNMKTGSGDDAMLIGAELEYILVGTNSELVNQTMVFLQIYALRFVLDLPSVFTDGFVSSIATVATIGALVVYLLYMIVEPLLDTVLLVNGGEVPLIRTKCWVTPSGFTQYAEAFSKVVTSNEEVRQAIISEGTKATDKLKTYSNVIDSGSSTGIAEIEYETHLLLLLLSSTNSNTLVKRFQNIVELEAKEYYKQQGKSFSLDKAYIGVRLETDIRFNSFFDVGEYANGTPLEMKARMKQSVCY